ncbi:MAG: glucosaminidase domain-containing protein [Proteobacteria bacterium]|nr:glucosaminidase domain-containing protein [Pseudomonadota bacterium]
MRRGASWTASSRTRSRRWRRRSNSAPRVDRGAGSKPTEARLRTTLARILTLAAAAVGLCAPEVASAQGLPEIRTSPRNQVPACVTPARLMRFLGDRNPGLPAKFRNIASYYKQHGERLGVRWDYAFFQMVVETNYLLFRNEHGRGDVSPSQNNFAGIGTTGGGVPGDSFPDVSTGVLGQMQHLVAYSGEHVQSPVAPRTREKQDDIIAQSRRLRRAVTFRDLAGRWAADKKYNYSIGFVAGIYQKRFCSGPLREPEPQEIAQVDERGQGRRAVAFAGAQGAGGPRLAAAPVPAQRPATCRVFTASYGGKKNVLIRRRVGNEMQYTALAVLDGREAGLTDAFIRSHAEGGEALGEFPSRDDALTKAFNLCPGGGRLGHPG